MNMFKQSRKVLSLATVCFFLSTFSVFAAERPDAGKTLGGLEDRKPHPEKPGPGISVEEQGKTATPAGQGTRLKVGGFHITGQSLYGEDMLLALIGDAVGKELTFGELEAVAGHITKFFHEQGYIVATAYLPAQDIKDGVVEIRVVVGKYGKIDIRNKSSLGQSIAADFFTDIKSGDYIKGEILERVLLLLSDTSGIDVKTTLVPGTEQGTADLIVEIADGAKRSGQAYVDNWGNRFTGKTRTGFVMNFNNPRGLGDTLTVGGIYTGSGMSDYEFSYLLPTDSKGSKFGIGFSHMRYSLGEDFASLDANGIARTLSAYETFTLKRSREHNMSVRIGYGARWLQDRIDSTPSDSRKKASVWTLALNGDSQDKLGGGGITSYVLTLYSGRLSLNTADARTNDTLAHTEGSYSKTTLNLNRDQYINNRLNLNLSFTGQLAGKNLDSSEKLSLGGASAVRAYPPGEASGDEGYIFTAELRWDMPKPDFQLAFFYDSGKTKINKSPWDDSENERTLSGAGIGMIWRKGDYSLRLDYAWKISSDPATSDTDKSGRLWLQGAKRF